MMNRSKRIVLPPMDNMWFQRVFGFEEVERDYEATQRRLQQMQLPGNETILKRSDGTLLHCGSFELPSLPEMHQYCRELLTRVKEQQQASSTTNSHSTTKLSTTHQHDVLFGPIRAANIIADAYALHAHPDAAGSIIQAASQFNCLEFPSPEVIPEKGITDYCSDHTQGPACAIACGAGTAYRNYLVKVMDENGETTIGQRRHSQINTLDDILATLQSYRPDRRQPINVWNGYANAKSSTLDEWNVLIRQHADELRNLLKVGIQRHTQVTSLWPDQQVLVTQLYCSAIPVAYSQASDRAWEPMARLVLEGCYEITLLAGVREALEKALAAAAVAPAPPGQSESPVPPTRVFLTLVGGGVFGNDLEWIWSAIDRAFRIVTDDYGVALEVNFVHYSDTPPEAVNFVQNWNNRSNSNNATCAAPQL
jgi:hypothetical protein